MAIKLHALTITASFSDLSPAQEAALCADLHQVDLFGQSVALNVVSLVKHGDKAMLTLAKSMSTPLRISPATSRKK